MLRRKALGLTQVCRQVRDEFLPMHRQHISAHVQDVATLEKFVDVFFHDLEKACGTVVLSPSSTKYNVELAPLIRLLLAAPQLVIKFGDVYKIYESCLNSLIDVRLNDTWKKFFEEAVTSVLHTPRRLIIKPQLRLKIISLVEEPWMTSKPDYTADEILRNDYLVHMEDWLQRIGLGQVPIPPDLIDITVRHVLPHDAVPSREPARRADSNDEVEGLNPLQEYTGNVHRRPGNRAVAVEPGLVQAGMRMDQRRDTQRLRNIPENSYA